jgi:hypothetical protein
MKDAFRISIGKCEGKKPLGDIHLGGKIILKCFLRKFGDRI